jgi:small subunit ribosomal protein S6
MRPYEVMVILEPSLEESQVQAIVNRSSELLQSAGGTVHRVDKWGKRRFAYELKKRQEGYYVLLDVSAEPAPMAELDRVLGLADEVLRHKIIRVPEHATGRSTRPSTPAEPVGSGSRTDSERGANRA